MKLYFLWSVIQSQFQTYCLILCVTKINNWFVFQPSNNGFCRSLGTKQVFFSQLLFYFIFCEKNLWTLFLLHNMWIDIKYCLPLDSLSILYGFFLQIKSIKIKSQCFFKTNMIKTRYKIRNRVFLPIW